MNYATIKYTDIANGEGVRVSLFVSGCRHHCKNCFNEVAWDFSYGNKFDETIQEKIIKELSPDFIAGLTVLGGEPMEPENQEGLYPFLKKVRELLPNKTIWMYTGYTFDELNGKLKENKNTEYTQKIFSLLDVLVDGAYIDELHDIRLVFRGSSNQRVLDVQKTLKEKKAVLYLE